MTTAGFFGHNGKVRLSDLLSRGGGLTLSNLIELGLGVGRSILEHHCRDIPFGKFGFADVQLLSNGSAALRERPLLGPNREAKAGDVANLARMLQHVAKRCRLERDRDYPALQRLLASSVQRPPLIGDFMLAISRVTQPHGIDIWQSRVSLRRRRRHWKVRKFNVKAAMRASIPPAVAALVAFASWGIAINLLANRL